MRAMVRQLGDVSVIDLSGKITIGRGDRILRESINDLLRSGHRRILLNLERVSYMDSSGIGELSLRIRSPLPAVIISISTRPSITPPPVRSRPAGFVNNGMRRAGVRN